MWKLIWNIHEIIFSLYDKYYLKVIRIIKRVIYILCTSILNTVIFYRLLRNESDKFLSRNIFVFWLITLISCLIFSCVVQIVCYPFVHDVVVRYLLECFVMLVGGIIMNVFFFQLIHGGTFLFGCDFNFKAWLGAASDTIGHIMNIISMLAIVAALITKDYAEILNWLLLSIAAITIICSISIELYKKVIMVDYEARLYCFMIRGSDNGWNNDSNIKCEERIIDLPERIRLDLVALAKKYGLKKIILFGSRSRGDNHIKSDVDIAVCGCDNFSDFLIDVEENVWTLLSFDVINMDEPISGELRREIQRDGVILYEKI